MQVHQGNAPTSADSGSLVELLRVAIARAKSLGRSLVFSYSRSWEPVDPLSFLAIAARPDRPEFYWEHPERGFSLAAAGAIASMPEVIAPQNRFEAARQFALEHLNHAVVAGESGASLYILGGMAFHDILIPPAWHGFPPAMLFIPQWAIAQTDGRSLLTVNLHITAHDDPEAVAVSLQERFASFQHPAGYATPNHIAGDALPLRAPEGTPALQLADARAESVWSQAVSQAVRQIQAGALEKVVLARALEIVSPQTIDSYGVLHALRQEYPECISFLVNLGKGTAFLGATPELLLQFQTVADTLCFHSKAVAGSSGRGRSLEEDRLLGERLMLSPKDRSEHGIVVRSICDRLRHMGATLEPTGEPELLKLKNVQHLYTPISGRLVHAGIPDAFNLVAYLHPTAAVGGEPRETAIPMMQTWEDSDRGWYAAPIGWVNSRGEGAFAVGIRSGYIRGNRARIYAGAGIVAASEAATELGETAIKFEALLKALGVQLPVPGR